MAGALTRLRANNPAGRIDRFLGPKPTPSLTDTVSATTNTPPPSPRPADPDDVFDLGEYGGEGGGAAVDTQPGEQQAGAEPEFSELELLRAENAELRETLTKLEEVTAENAVTIQLWEEQLKEHEKLLEEKSGVIRDLHQQNLELKTRPAPATPHEAELLAMSEELETERNQLREDEGALMKQMRDMELQMSRERAELARQRNDVQRLHSEIKHELELAERENALRDRLLPLQRRHQDILTRRSGEPPPSKNTPAPKPIISAPAASSTGATPTPEGGRVTSGLFRRLFG